jgi:hypothetical protein
VEPETRNQEIEDKVQGISEWHLVEVHARTLIDADGKSGMPLILMVQD